MNPAMSLTFQSPGRVTRVAGYPEQLETLLPVSFPPYLAVAYSCFVTKMDTGTTCTVSPQGRGADRHGKRPGE